MNRRVFFYVQHLWGVGHVYRATRIAHGLKRAGFEVHLIWGGTQVPGFDFTGLSVHHLAPVRTSDASFSQLLHADGRKFDGADKHSRASALLELFDTLKPGILVTEAFPFGRRQMQYELLPLLERAASAKPRPLIVSSIRDIMQEGRREKRIEESNRLVSEYFDLVLVHGDPAFFRIEETLEGTDTFAEKIRYTGLVVPDRQGLPDYSEKEHDVVASVGGGAFGRELLECVLEARMLAPSTSKPWLVAAGSELSGTDLGALKRKVPAGVELVRHIPDMVGAMVQAGVSVSHAGYNTVADVLCSGCKAVLYPYTGGRETEQSRRAERLDKIGLAKWIEPGSLTPEVLLDAIGAASRLERPDVGLDLSGADRTAKVLQMELKSR